MYLDPGFGGMLIQIIVALIAGGGAIAFAMRKKIRAFFSKNKEKNNATERIVGNADNLADDVVDMLSDDESASK